MFKRGSEDGYTLIELMIVISVVGVLAFPGVNQVISSAKLTGVMTNYRSVTTALYGLHTTDSVAAKLTSFFGNSVSPKVEDMKNPITNKMGVATSVALAEEPTAAVYVLDETVTTVPSEVARSEYRGAIVAVVQADKSIVVFGCDEVGRLITGLQMTIQH